MSSPTARLILASDAAAAAIAAAWVPVSPNAASREYVAEEQLKDIDGRQVYVVPGGVAEVASATRGEKIYSYRISVRVAKRFTDPGRPTKAWIDTEVQFLDTVWNALNLTTPANLLLGTMWTETIEITDCANVEAILAHKLFWAEMEVEFREIN